MDVFVFSVFVNGFVNRARVQRAVTMHCCTMNFRHYTRLLMRTDDVDDADVPDFLLLQLASSIVVCCSSKC